MVRGGDVHDVIVVSGHCVLGRWLTDLIREICAVANVELQAGEGDDIYTDLGRTGEAPRVLLTAALSRRHIDLLEAGKVPVLAVLDDPVDSVRFTRSDKSVGLHDALKEQTRIVATNYALLDNPLVTIIARSFSGSAHDVIAAVVDRLRAEPEPAGLQALLERFGGPLDHPWTLEQALAARVPHYLQLDHLGDAMSADEATIVRQVVSPLALAAVSHEIGTVIWTAKVFFFGDRPNETAPPVADVTGAARIIFYGPYFHLPPGTWKARIVVAFSPEVSGTPFKLVVFCEHDAIAKVILRPTDGGAFEGFFTMRHVAPERPIEIHFNSEEGTIEGHVAFGQITFSRLSG